MQTALKEKTITPPEDIETIIHTNGNGAGYIAPRTKSDEQWENHSFPTAWQNPTPSGRYNLVVIGGGSAGLVAAVGAAGLGAKVALIEKRWLGGDCLNVGCIPSKTLIRSAKALGEIEKAARFAVHVPNGTTVDFRAVVDRVHEVRAEISEDDSIYRFQELGIDVFLGAGKFTSESTIEVAGQTLEFSKALIATGSRPMHLPIPGLAETGYLTNETVFDMTELPRRLAVVGAGPIGAEMAQAFQRFGSEVTVFDIVPKLLGREDDQAAAVIKDIFLREGIKLALGAKTSQVRLEGDEKVVEYELDGENHEGRFEEILVAAGRVPNIDTLDLEAAGVEYHKRGVTVDDTMQTTNPNVYAAGDIAFKFQFTHTADATARIVLQNALFPGPSKKVTDLIVPWTTYTDPEVAHVGLYEHEAEEQGIKVETIVQPIGHIDRGRADGDQEGFVKVHIQKGTDKILGATIVARHAGEMISEITLAMTAGIGLKKLATVIHPYPTQAEAIKKVADAYNRTRLTPIVKKIFQWWLARTR